MNEAFQDRNRPLGEYTGILAVDVRSFSKHNNAQQKTIVELLPDVIKQATSRVGIAELWDEHVFRAFRGDGYLIGFHPDLASAVVDRFFDSLQNELRRRSGEFRAAEIELRLRTSVHLGPVQSFNALIEDSPSGKFMVDTGRMVDAEPVRALLDHSDPNVTFVASVLSRAVMEQVVEAGLTTRQPSEFVEAPLQVEAKEYSGTGYLRVPAPSGELLSLGLLRTQPEPESESTTAQRSDLGAPTSNTFSGSAENAMQAGTVHGGVHNNSTRDVSGGIAVSGSGSVNVGGDIDQSSGKQDFSGTFLTQGDSNFGPSSGRRIGTDNDQAGR